MKKLLFAVLGLTMVLPSVIKAQDLYWRTDGATGGNWTSSSWSNPASSTGGSGWTSGSNAIFTANSTFAYVTGNLFGNITLTDGIAVTGTFAGTAPAGAHTYNIGTGSTLTWTGQNFTAAGTSFIKTGAGTWSMGSIGNAYTGGFILNAGTVIATGNNSLGAGNLTINGGTIQTSGGRSFAATSIIIGGDFSFTGTGNDNYGAPVALGNATRTITNSSSGNRTFNGVISSSGNGGGLTKAGNSTIILNAANTYAGATSVSNGILALGANGTLASSSTLNIAAGATFDVKAKTTFALGSAGMTIDVGAANAGKLDGGNVVALTYAGALTLNITSATPLSSYNLFAFASETGTFDSITLAGSGFSGPMASSSGLWTRTSGGYDFTFNESTGILTTAAIPEPTTLALIAFGSAFVLWRIRFRRKVV